MTKDQDPKGHWGGYSFSDGFGASVFLSAESKAEYRGHVFGTSSTDIWLTEVAAL
ncbi:MAG: hypothetical protein QGI68_17470 [Pseudomonadales bacterium]|jgi:hypothetical protein|nr:hypothetical protein [Pseudomonadales bacterium]MDP7358575.1 hypothetical protein [Pseudomonadales bacterium]MDP7597335.1 hypothetical protein [Pseudomonadales bacterium]HJN49264.1 hypothetical protein [Pseudomonadales bacterium]